MQDYIKKASKRLQSSQEELNQLKMEQVYEFHFNTGQLSSQESILDVIQDIQNIKSPVIYVFSYKTSELSITDDFEKFKKEDNAGVCLSRFNEASKDSEIIYVGSKMKDIRSRLKQHLGIMTKSTYSLHLKRWVKSPYDFTVSIYHLHSRNNTVVSQYLIEVVEQEMWETLQPIFGKKSGH